MVTVDTCFSLRTDIDSNSRMAADIDVKVHLPSSKSRGFYLKKFFVMKNRRKDREATTPVGPEEAKAYLEEDVSQECLVEADFVSLVVLPHGIDYSEWLATHTISFFEHVNILYGCVTEFCQSGNCTSLSGSGSLPYQWIDDRGKKCKCSASQYIDYVMSFSQKHVHDESVFPTKYGNVFPNSFEATVKKMHRLLLHVLAHIYQCHWQEIVLFKLPTHLNTVFYHFHLFNKQFNLVEDKEMEVLDDLFQRLHHHATTHKSGLEGTIPAGSSSVATSVPNAATTGSGTHTVSTAVQTDSVVNMLSSSREKKENSVVCDSYPVLTLVT